MLVQGYSMEDGIIDNSNRRADNASHSRETGSDLSAAWKSRLQSLTRDLAIVNRETERDYLDIGSLLDQFHIRSKDIAHVSSSVSSSMAGAEITDVISELQRITERTRAYIDSSGDRLEKRKEVLKEAIEMIENMNEPVRDLRGIIRNMKYLGLSSKIHSAQIVKERSDFVVLADDIKKLSNIIESKSSEIKSNLSTLRTIIDHDGSGIIDIQTEHSLILRNILTEFSTIISSLQEKHELSKKKAERISELSTEVSTNISGIVESVQFHDIVRQQFEHVGEALVQLVDAIDSEHDPVSNDSLGLITHVRDVCELQLTQIAHARDQLISSMRLITDNLETVSENATMMLNEARWIVAYDDRDDRSFMYEMERSLMTASSAITAFSDDVESNRELTDTMKGIDGTANRMTSFISDMDEIESEIEVIALNASVKAAKIGESGLALGVVAQMMQKVSVKAHVITATISQFINTIKLAIKILSSQVSSDEDTNEAGKIKYDLEETLRSLRNINDEIHNSLLSVSEKGEDLSVSIRETLKNIREHDLAGKVLDRVIEGLREIVDEATLYVEGRAKVDTDAFLSGLSKHYSMKSEHSIHKTFVISRGNGDSPPSGEKSVSETDEESGIRKSEFGDNVEFF
jgi:methyl-accepting chemotaxis protein